MDIASDSEKMPPIKDFWPKYYRRAILIVVITQLIVGIVVSAALILSGVHVRDIEFVVAIVATVVTASFLNVAIVKLLLVPLRDISVAITNAAGEKPTEPLANPNTQQYQKNGFKPVLQFVYNLAAKQDRKDTPETAAIPTELQHLAVAFEQTKAGIVILNADGDVQYANKHAPVSTGADEHPHLDLLFETETTFSDWLANCRDQAVHADTTWLRVPDRIVGDEDRRIFNVTASYEKGSAAEVVLVLFDSTDRYQPEDEELDFIAFAAHELRGPITVIRGYLDVLDMELSDTLSAEQKELMKRLIVSANRLTGYINNILNTSKFDRRHLQVHLNEDSIASIYAMIADDMMMRASSQSRLLTVTIPDGLPTIAADRSSLSEVISNLIDNAIKYSNEGGAIEMTARQQGDFVEVLVTDHGIGMPSNIIGNLFHKFYRSHRSRETVAGTGIGLYICKAIVESHGGTIGVTSVEGQGSTFSFTVPTYASVADKLQANDHTNAGLITTHDGWIKNHGKLTG